MEASLVLTTTPSSEVAEKIARDLVEGGLAACVNVVGKVRSVYRWKGEVVEEDEYLVFIKTRRDFLPQVESRIKALHPYEVPEIISLPVAWGSREYLGWIEASTKS